MKATIKFYLDCPEDKQSHLRCIKANDMSFTLWDIDQLIKQEIKYNEGLTEDQHKILEKIKDKFHEIIEEYDIGFIYEG